MPATVKPPTNTLSRKKLIAHLRHLDEIYKSAAVRAFQDGHGGEGHHYHGRSEVLRALIKEVEDVTRFVSPIPEPPSGPCWLCDQPTPRRGYGGDKVWDALRELAERQGITYTEALRRAISTEVFVDSVIAEGSELAVRRKDGNFERIIFR